MYICDFLWESTSHPCYLFLKSLKTFFTLSLRKPNITFFHWIIIIVEADKLLKNQASDWTLCFYGNGQATFRKILRASRRMWYEEHAFVMCVQQHSANNFQMTFCISKLYLDAYTSALLLAVLSNSFEWVYFKYLKAFPFLRSPDNAYDDDLSSFLSWWIL